VGRPLPPAAGTSTNSNLSEFLDGVRFSVIIPTFGRRERVLRTVSALERQHCRDFEVIVVVDGSTDETAEALRALKVSFPLVVAEQENKGAGQARNTGAERARGEVLLFLDDDMEAHPSLLVEHDRCHRGGADLVLGDLPLHSESPKNVLNRRVGAWAQARAKRLGRDGGEIRADDLITGQMSISRDAFERMGGFDPSFTRNGLFGGEDVDFGHRVKRGGLRIAFNPQAISYQYYDVDPATFLRRASEAGRAAQELIAKHPGEAEEFARGPHFHTRLSRLLFGPLVLAPGPFGWPVRAVTAYLVRRGLDAAPLNWAFFQIRTVEYLRGARAARKILSTGEAVVLAYHAVEDRRHDTILGAYAVSRDQLAGHLDGLLRSGWTFVDLDAVLQALSGEGNLPRRSVVVTFDDAYADFLTAGWPVLAKRGIPAVVFAVAGRLGGTNEWDRELGGGSKDLLDDEGLRTIAGLGVEIGSHGWSHRKLSAVSTAELEEELERSAAHLEALGLPRPRALAYPYGDWTADVAAAVRQAGYAVAFTVEPGVVRRTSLRYSLPRVEVLAVDTPRMLRLKIATAAWPDYWRRGLSRMFRAFV
jgi:peptidoglycan/xylan/chitin deacetylase (PgdA/CDA1 family)/glycosyltransferase involved in cell wall biosynthesis